MQLVGSLRLAFAAPLSSHAVLLSSLQPPLIVIAALSVTTFTHHHHHVCGVSVKNYTSMHKAELNKTTCRAAVIIVVIIFVVITQLAY